MTHKTTPHMVERTYSGLVNEGKLENDDAQRQLARRLDNLLEGLEQIRLARKSSALGWLFSQKTSKQGYPKGIYIHGGVGRGKSMLMDIFFDAAPQTRKRRVHFNAFMADAQDRIQQHRKAFEEGTVKEADPIGPVAGALAREAKLLCFDEFTVTDIADAMILGRLFDAMFKKGVVVVATSNVVPGELYRDGLNRKLFEPFIELLLEHCEVFELDANEDYRLAHVDRGQAYLSPVNEATETAMETIWKRLSNGQADQKEALALKGRAIEVDRANGDMAWLTFDQLCVEPRSARDYLAIAERFNTVFVVDVPMMDQKMRNEAKRFILLIDTFYDNSIRTIISAEVNPHALYTGAVGTEAFEFQRTISRLIEMQSSVYHEKFEEKHQQNEVLSTEN